MFLMPSNFNDHRMNDWMFDFDKSFFGNSDPLFGKHARNLMKTDVKEKEGEYLLAVDLPGFKKEDIHLELNDGYLSIQAVKGLEKDEKSEEGRLIRQERYAGSLSRSFYVGSEVTEEDIHARFEDGVLRLSVPKKEKEEKVSEKKCIAIEG